MVYGLGQEFRWPRTEDGVPVTMTQRCRFARVLVLSLLVGSVMARALAEPSKKDLPGLPNFHQVTASIYRGGAPTKEGLKKLRALKIHTIIDLRIEHHLAQAEKKTAEEMGFTWLNIPMGKQAPTKKQVDTFLTTLAKAPKAPVFVHCQHGADRTGCMIGIYRARVQGWPFTRAWAEMRKYGFKPYLSELKEAVRSRARAT